MERNEFKKRVKRLITWILAVALTMCGSHSAVIEVLAAGATVTLPINYKTDGGTITSESYTTEVTLEETATSAEVILPTVEWKGYIFNEWKCELSSGGSYGTGEQTLTWDSYTPASSISEIPMTADWIEALVGSVTYDLDGGSLDGSESVFSKEYIQPDVDTTTFEEVVPEQVPKKDGCIFLAWEMKSTDTGEEINYNGETRVLTGVYGNHYTLLAHWRAGNIVNILYEMPEGYENAGQVEGEMQILYNESATAGPVEITLPKVTNLKNEWLFVGWKCMNANGEEYLPDAEAYVHNIYGTETDCYPAETVLKFAYPRDEKNVGGNIAEYTFVAQFVNAKTISVSYDANGGSGLETLEATIYQQNVNDEEGSITLPEAPTREGYTFAGWLSSADEQIYEAGKSVSCSFSVTEVKFTAEWKKLEDTIRVIGEGTHTLQAGVKYKLAEGNWRMNNDSSIYTGGRYFYVSKDGSYTFNAE